MSLLNKMIPKWITMNSQVYWQVLISLLTFYKAQIVFEDQKMRQIYMQISLNIKSNLEVLENSINLFWCY